MLLKITAIFCVLGFLCLKDATTQPTTVRPYKFGFTIDEQQHRSEQRDERGIVMGEFGFITADGIYHVTVYATDENGKFRILAMRNYPYTPVAPKAITTSTTTTEQPKQAPPRYNFNTDACSGCSLLNGKGSKKNDVAPGSSKTEIRTLSKPLALDVPETTRPGSVEEIEALRKAVPELFQNIDQVQAISGQLPYHVTPASLGIPTQTLNTLPSTHTQTKPTNTHIDRKLIDEVRIGSAVAVMRKFEAQKQSGTKAPLTVTGKVATSSKFSNPIKNRNVNYLVGVEAKTPTAATNKLGTSGAANVVTTPLKVNLERQILQSPSGGLFTSANLPLRTSDSSIGGASAPSIKATTAGNTFGAVGTAPAGKLPFSATSNIRRNDNTGKPSVGLQYATSLPNKSNQISSAPSPLIVPPTGAKYSAGYTKTSKPILNAVKDFSTPLGNSGLVQSNAPLQNIASPGGLSTHKDNQKPLYALIDTPQSAVGRITPGSQVGPKITGTKKQNQFAAGISDVIVPMRATVVADRKAHQPTQAHVHDLHTPQHTNIYNQFATQPSQQPNAKLPQTQTGSAPLTPTNTAFNSPKAVVPLTQTQTNTQQPGLNAIGNSNAQAPQTGNRNTPNTATQTVNGNNAPQAAPGIDIRFDQTATPQAAGKPTTQAGTPTRPAGSSGNSGSIDDTGDLYRFKYILDYNGHTETGGGNGNKVGNYFAIGDDDVERTIEYIANEFGFQPQVRWRKVDAKALPKDNTLKDYEFTWFKKE